MCSVWNFTRSSFIASTATRTCSNSARRTSSARRSWFQLTASGSGLRLLESQFGSWSVFVLVMIALPSRFDSRIVAADHRAGDRNDADAFADEQASDVHRAVDRHAFAGDCFPRTPRAKLFEEVVVNASVLDHESFRRHVLVSRFDLNRVVEGSHVGLTAAVSKDVANHVDRVEFAVARHHQFHIT